MGRHGRQPSPSSSAHRRTQQKLFSAVRLRAAPLALLSLLPLMLLTTLSLAQPIPPRLPEAMRKNKLTLRYARPWDKPYSAPASRARNKVRLRLRFSRPGAQSASSNQLLSPRPEAEAKEFTKLAPLGWGAGKTTVRVKGTYPPQLFVQLVSRKGEVVGVQEQLRVVPAVSASSSIGVTDTDLWAVEFNFSCLDPGRFIATIFLEQDGDNTASFPPPTTWLNDSLPAHPRPSRFRPDNARLPEYAASMPIVTWKQLTRENIECRLLTDAGVGAGITADQRVSAVSLAFPNVFPHSGSWVKTRDALPRNPCCPWNSVWFQRIVEKPKVQQNLRSQPSAYTKYQHFVPHGLLYGRPLTRYYLHPEQLSSALAAQRLLPFTLFLGDSVLNNVWEAFVAMSPQILRHIDWRFGGVIINKIDEARGWDGGEGGGGPASLMKWLVNVSFDRYSNFTDFSVSAGASDPLFLSVGRQPTHIVVGAGLWDAQSRPPSEFAKYLPILITSLKRLFPSAHIVWLTAPPVDASQLKGRHYRTNEYLTAVSRIAKTTLAGEEGVTVVDGFGILSAVRQTSTDGRHYPASTCIDIANILWNVVLTDSPSRRSSGRATPANTPVSGGGLYPNNSTCTLKQVNPASPINSAASSPSSSLPQLCSPQPAKYSNDYCLALPPVAPSEDCNLLDLSSPEVFEGPERELLLWGDSIMLQLHQAILCQLARHAPKGTSVEKLTTATPRRRLLRTDSQPAQYGSVVPAAPCNAKKACFRFGSLTVCIIPITQHVFTEQTAPCLLTGRPHDVHIFNVGMWHNQKAAMQQSVSAFRAFVSAAQEKGHMLPHMLWQESTPQHFQSEGGNYVAGSKLLNGCMASADSASMRQHEWRNAVARRVLDGLPGVKVFHLWDMLHLWPQLHVQKLRGEETDCTHWCATPKGAMASVAQIMLSDVHRTFWAELE